MNENQMRKEFEEFTVWYLKEFGFHPTLANRMSIHAQSRWQAWQASRQAMKPIKLPNAIKADNRLLGDNEYCSGYNQALRDCEKQITSAGYKVEE